MLKKAVIILGIAVAVAVVLLFIYLNTIAKSLIENYGSSAMGTRVTVGVVSISPFSGNISLRNLKVASPGGFKSEYVFLIEKIKINVVLTSLLGNVVYVNDMEIAEPEIVYEVGLNGYNMDSLKSSTARSSGSSKSSRKIIIDKLAITSGKVNVVTNIIGENAKQQIALPDIHLTGIGSRDNGIILSEAILQILQAITREISQMDFNTVEKQIKNLGDKFKDNVKMLNSIIKK